MKKKHMFSGTVSRVTADGGAAVVVLDQEMEGRNLAVISSDTAGRRRLHLAPGLRVSGVAQTGPDALDAISVERTHEDVVGALRRND